MKPNTKLADVLWEADRHLDTLIEAIEAAKALAALYRKWRSILATTTTAALRRLLFR